MKGDLTSLFNLSKRKNNECFCTSVLVCIFWYEFEGEPLGVAFDRAVCEGWSVSQPWQPDAHCEVQLLPVLSTTEDFPGSYWTSRNGNR